MSFAHIVQEPGSPTIVALHGTGGDELGALRMARTLAPKRFGVIAVRGNEPEGDLNRFFLRKAEGVFDEPNLLERTDELADWAIKEVPGPRIALGFSNGANIAAATILRRPEAFDAAVLLAPMVPFTPDDLPDLTGKPVLMVCGERDPIVPLSNAMTLATMLQTAGADLTVHRHPGGHELDTVGARVAASWLAGLPAAQSA